MNDLITIARIVRTRGTRGEVVADLLTDFPERFRSVLRVYVNSSEKSHSEELESYWFHKNRVILKFVGRDHPHEVSELIGCEVQIPESERVTLPDETYFDSDLEDCEVVENDRLIGRVERVEKVGGAAANLLVLDQDDQEFLVPLIREFVLDIDLEHQRIHVHLPPGLRELSIRRKPKRSKKASL